MRFRARPRDTAGTAAARYIDAFFANVHWEEVDRRTEQAQKIVALLS